MITSKNDNTTSKLFIQPTRNPRVGWTEVFTYPAGSEDDVLFDMPTSTWDETEWEW